MNFTKGLPRPAAKDELVGIDTEFFGMTRPHRADGTFAALTIAYPNGDAYIVTRQSDIAPALKRVAGGTWVMHNALFDLRALRRYVDIKQRYVHDTMLVEQDLFGGWYGDFSLADLNRRWIGERLEKEVRADFSGRESMTPEMETYAVQDALATVRIAQKQIDYINEHEDGQFEWYYEIDEPALWAVLDMPPVRVDVKAWRKNIATLQVEAGRLEEDLGFNAYSHVQVKKQIEKALGHGIKNTNASDTLLPLLRRLVAGSKEYRLVQAVLDVREARKAVETFGENWIEKHVEEGDLVYPSWRVTGAETGRMSCIAKGALIDAPRNLLLHPRGIPIESIVPGQIVYSFDKLGTPRARKVLQKTLVGNRNVLKLVWRASGSKSYLGELKATPDHLIRLLDGSYKRLDELKPGDKLSFLSRAMDGEGRAYIRWGMDRKVYEHRHLLGSPGGQVVHHINWIPQDNSINNLVVMSKEDHRRLHAKGRPGHVVWCCPYSQDEFLELTKNGARTAMRLSGHDHSTLKRWAQEINVEIPDKRLSRYRTKTDLPTNHVVVMVVSEGEVLPVYDLTVEKDENFVANEICVHNCSNPNLQQVPARKMPIFRSFFTAPKGQYMLVTDSQQQEVRLASALSRDDKLIQELNDGVDLHQVTADMFGVDRDRGKAINLGLNYGMSGYGLAAMLGISEDEADAGIRVRERRYKGLSAWQNMTTNKAQKQLKVRSLSGRPIWINPYLSHDGWKRNAINGPIQASAADHTKRALVAMHQMCEDEGVPFGVCMAVHDEIVSNVPVGMMKTYKKIAKDAWREAGVAMTTVVELPIETASGRSWACKS